MKFTSSLAILGSVSLAVSAQPHRHAHRHAERHQPARVEERADVTTWVPGPTETVYVLDGKKLSAEEVNDGLADGIYVLVPDAATSVKPAEFYQKKTSTTAPTPTPTPTTSSTPPPPPTTSSTSSTPVAAPSYSAAASSSASASSGSSSGSSSGGSGLSSSFPSGTIPCSEFPSSYGAVALDYLGLDGWSGVQTCGGYTKGQSSISDIVTAVTGMGGCTAGSFCSYACPAGYQKIQWPSAQGATGQSIGGLYCNSDGFLETTNDAYDTLCIAGTGQTTVTNKLSQNVAVCRTDYPGTESETIPLNVAAGATEDLTCPDASNYYNWGGKSTSAQYYVNPAGTSQEDACQWGNGGSQIGNWAPLNIGVGKSTTGETFISMFWNKPTNPNPSLGFNVEIQGGISGTCKLEDGVFYSNGVASASGCTVSLVED
jgi:hypothetical protein